MESRKRVARSGVDEEEGKKHADGVTDVTPEKVISDAFVVLSSRQFSNRSNAIPGASQ